MSSRSNTNFNFLYSIYFFLFFVSLFLLSTGHLSLEDQLWVGFFGLILPLSIGLLLSLQNRSKDLVIEKNNPFPLPLMIGLGALLIFLRFYHLGSVPYWPLSDESVFSTLALELNKKWSWNLLCSEGQMEPLLLWILSLFFKVTSPSILTLRLFTVFISLASTLAAYLAARTFWDRSWAFVFALLFSFSFWETDLSRQCTPNDLIPSFELIAFFFVSRYYQTKTRWPWVMVLGLWCGFGFYVFINWVAVWALVLLILLAIDLKKEYPKIFAFLVLSSVIAMPLAWARLASHASTYLQYRFLGSAWCASSFNYLRGLFWDGSASFPLGPARGGYLDALTGALVLVGLLAAFQRFPKKLLALLAVGILLALLPGILTNNLELQRITPLLPLLIFLALWGIRSLLASSSPFYRATILSAVLLGIAGLNAYQLFAPYNDFSLDPPGRHWRSHDYFCAYQTLKTRSEKTGPIYVFNEWNGDYFDKTLDLACFPFNAAQNAALSNAQWMAFLTDADYRPMLQKRFPHLEMLTLDPAASPDHLLRLFLVPLADVKPQTLQTWLMADQEARQEAVAILNRDPSLPWSVFEKKYAELAAQYDQDPFLVSVFWEKAASFLLIDRQYAPAVTCFQKVIRAGYDTPHLRHNLSLAVSLSRKNLSTP